MYWKLPESEVLEKLLQVEAENAVGAPPPAPDPLLPVGFEALREQHFTEAPPGPGQFLGDPNEVVVFEPEVPVHIGGGLSPSHPAYQIMLGMVNNVGMFINNVLGMDVNRPAQPPGIRVDGRSMYECEVCARLFTSRYNLKRHRESQHYIIN